jgi:hypothetical protein
MARSMRHTRDEVVDRTVREFEILDRLVAGLSPEDWSRTVAAPGRDPWTVKDALAHVTYWKADVARFARGQRRPPETKGLRITHDFNRWVYEQWCERSPAEVLDYHRQVHDDTLKALDEAPESWFNGKERSFRWPSDIDGHLAAHRVREIERTLATIR